MRREPSRAAPIDRIRSHLVGLKMPRALEMLDHVVRQLERGEIERARGHRRPAHRGTDAAREPPRQDGAADGAAVDHQDARRLRLLLPALARPEPHHGARRAGVHRPRRGRPLHRPARHRQEPSGQRARRRGGAKPAAASTSARSPISSLRSPRPNAKALCANGSASSAASRCSIVDEIGYLPSFPAAAICSSSSSTPATRRAP